MKRYFKFKDTFQRPKLDWPTDGFLFFASLAEDVNFVIGARENGERVVLSVQIQHQHPLMLTIQAQF